MIKLLPIICMLFLAVPKSTAGDSYILWASNLVHHYEKPGKYCKEWTSTFKQLGVINASFFRGNRSLISPYASQTVSKYTTNKHEWWYINYSHDIFEVKSHGTPIDLTSKFIVSVCPPLIVNGVDMSKSFITAMGGRKFAYRNCRRTMIGTTSSGSIFIVVGAGNLFTLRKLLRNKIKNILWLANLDGGSSTFLSVNNKSIVKNKTKIPSVISFEIIKMESFK
jgi:exopolysaccharide biosynthesis protein